MRAGSVRDRPRLALPSRRRLGRNRSNSPPTPRCLPRESIDWHSGRDGLSAHSFVTRQQIDEVLNIIRNAPKPLLVHCTSGADRSGLVSALYRLADEGASVDQADRQLSLIYGHFPYLTSRSKAMDDSFW